jgi:hypothetical protein
LVGNSEKLVGVSFVDPSHPLLRESSNGNGDRRDPFKNPVIGDQFTMDDDQGPWTIHDLSPTVLIWDTGDGRFLAVSRSDLDEMAAEGWTANATGQA